MGTAVTIYVRDALPSPAIQGLVDDLARQTHEAAAKQWQREPKCKYLAFSPELAGRGRAEFEAIMRSSGCDESLIVRKLRDWDEAHRPVAIFHWFKPDDA